MMPWLVNLEFMENISLKYPKLEKHFGFKLTLI